ncbi:amino acid/amide ABC transporter ATP-binding protein 2 (HAAT family) [Stella humosa]|uniref:Amino acid/amide ABC transporter ATP-binding protein 2 (HAAT family) n=1 Tax=Stella humosa TaxID=94 RepID=A0A3N1KSL0_9PROT|nr:ABC transporter ATP-binding protein [Stella humosa]ROP83571.1 amino acid/amide ABC transporter ATP-binding protein 2 (HAAT family) [Stella humosa]BBK33157.1 ABC transporter ATP-binding protein [Stella humosa]
MLDIRHLKVAYGITEVLRDVSFQVPTGSIVALLGGNGSGKTTMLNTLTGLVRPVAGSITFEGKECAGLAPDGIVRRGIAQVPQGREVWPTMSVHDNLELGAATRRDWPGIRSDLDDVYAMFPKLKVHKRRHAGSLSGGEQQMVAIGRALMARPRCLLMDEPSAGLAPSIVGDMVDTILALNRRGLTILLVEQNIGVAAAVAEHAHILQGGEIAFSGPAAGLIDNPAVLRSYLGR